MKKIYSAIAKIFFVVISFILSQAGPASAENIVQKDRASVISQIVALQSSLAEPLGGSYFAGEEIFKKADGVKEAQAVFKDKGLTLLLNTGRANPLGLCDDKLAQKLLLDPNILRLKIPSTGDAVSKNKQNYNDAAKAFATAFNKQMLLFKKIRTPDC